LEGFGANQFNGDHVEERKQKISVFNWWTFALCPVLLLCATKVVYGQNFVRWRVACFILAIFMASLAAFGTLISMAKNAVVAQNALVAQAKKGINASVEQQLSIVWKTINVVERKVEEVRTELQMLRAKQDENSIALAEENAAIAAIGARIIEKFRYKRAVVLISISEGDARNQRVILTMRSSKLSTYSGEVALPGGKADRLDQLIEP